SKDFVNWTKQGIVGPSTRSKAAVLFPEKINSKYIMLYTWMADSPLSSIMEIRFDTWEDIIKPPDDSFKDSIYHFRENVVFEPPEPVFRGAEVGAPPIKTKDGWLFIYCNANVSDHKEWTISAALLDLENPKKVLAYTEKPILRPENNTELNGVINNVTFPSGAVIVGEELFVYYGSGDQGCCLATCKLKELISNLKSSS
ncbi:MAG: hypothetical protein ABIO02_04775, partial [Patescibacteria group bacterium]